MTILRAAYHKIASGLAFMPVVVLLACSFATLQAIPAVAVDGLYLPASPEPGTEVPQADIKFGMRPYADNTFYIIGTVAGPHPYPMMVRDFQSVIGEECLAQMPELAGRQPDALIACVGGGSNAIGIFHAFIPDQSVRLVGCEAGGDGLDTGRHAATLTGGSPGVLHGMRTFVLQDDEGQTRGTHSISAGLDYPGVGPEHVWLMETGRASYRAVTDAEAMQAFEVLCRTEGIIPAIESAHALAGALQIGRELGPDGLIMVNLSGRGDKDVDTASKWFGL